MWLAILLTAILIMVVIIWHLYEDIKEYRSIVRYYNELKIGQIVDMVIFNNNDNPFEYKEYRYQIKILEKKDNYVKYQLLEDNLIYSEHISDIIPYIQK